LTLGLILGLVACVTGAGLGMRALVRREHDALLVQLRDTYRRQLAEAVNEVSDGLDDQSDVVRLSGELMTSGGLPQDHQREFAASRPRRTGLHWTRIKS